MSRTENKVNLQLNNKFTLFDLDQKHYLKISLVCFGLTAFALATIPNIRF